MKRAIAGLISLCLVLGSSFTAVCAPEEKINTDSMVQVDSQSDTYSLYANKYENAPSDIRITKKGADFETATEGFSVDSAAHFEDCTVTYKFNVENNGLYNIGLNYMINDDSQENAELSVKINGKTPFDLAENITLYRYWKDNGEVRKDASGNETAPLQMNFGEYVTEFLRDKRGVENRPYCFYFEKGENTLSLEFEYARVSVKEIFISSPEEHEAYKSPENADTKGETIVLEAEKPYTKNSRSITAKSENGSIDISPSSPVKQLVNFIGASNWQNPNEEIVWQFDVPQSGYYKIGYIYKQNKVLNGNVYRRIMIDGKLPFSEAESVKFGYTRNWDLGVFADEMENPYYLYLEKGTHTVSFAVTLGDSAPVYNSLQEVCTSLRELYLSIIMITGETPDSNRDYDLYNQIPDFEKTLKSCKTSLDEIAEELRKLTGEKTNSQISVMVNTSRVLQNMIDNIYKAEIFLSDYYSNYSSLSSSLSDMCIMPLSLDRIQIAPAKGEFIFGQAKMLQRIGFGFKRFAASFSKEYDRISSMNEGSEEIKLWVNWGRDQAITLNNLIETTFTPKSDIRVNMQITGASVINGMLAGNAPDISLYNSRSDPVNYAMRGALYDLTQFEDFDEVTERFSETAMTPYKYKNGVYALPDSQGFYIMYYRKDILDQLGISVPETWDEFLSAATILRMNNMEAWVSYTQISDPATVNIGVGGLNLFASILQQRGGSFYNDKLNKCDLNSPKSIEAFNYWSDFYVKYKFPISVSFYNRFRVGITPLGIDGYALYSQLKELAPEIDGKWGIALVPGTKQADGTVDHTVSGSGSGCVVLNTSKHKDAAWKFIKWWTSADTQLSYNNEIEAVLGRIARISTSNVEAFNRMSWDSDDLKILNKQRSLIKEIPEVPGSYYVGRSVDQAFWAVYNKGENVKDALLNWSDIANDEIERKIKAYG